jgi:hypothetical protein
MAGLNWNARIAGTKIPTNGTNSLTKPTSCFGHGVDGLIQDGSKQPTAVGLRSAGPNGRCGLSALGVSAGWVRRQPEGTTSFASVFPVP